MDGNFLVEVLKTGIMSASSAVGSAVGALLGALFLRKNTEKVVYEEIKEGKFKSVADRLLATGQMTQYEHYRLINFLDIANKADDMMSEEKAEGSVILDKPYSIDWFVHFYEQAGTVSDEQMQALWASVLTRELTSPNSINLSLLHSLAIMRPEQANYFCNIARFVWLDAKNDSPHLLLFIATNRESYEGSRITIEQTKEMERLGLVECDFHREYVFDKKKVFRTGNHRIEIYGNSVNQNRIKAGNAVFTQDGQRLYSIIPEENKRYNADITNFLIGKFMTRGYRVVVNGSDRGLL